MGQKVHPTGIRLGIATDWTSKWYAGNDQYADFLKLIYQFPEFELDLEETFNQLGRHLKQQKELST